jgi:hypothetical protein
VSVCVRESVWLCVGVCVRKSVYVFVSYVVKTNIISLNTITILFSVMPP